MTRCLWLAFGVGAVIWLCGSAWADVTLVQDGTAMASIFVAPRVMAPDAQVPREAPLAEREAEEQRQRLRESVKDLALYLGRISGATIEVVQGPPPPDFAPAAILVGELATERFGPPAVRAPYKQGWRLVVQGNAVGLIGESDLATSYAIYEGLHRLGCRWYMPSELGEVIPTLTTIVAPEMDVSGEPSTIYRGIWCADEAFKRRNRQGGLLLSAGHALEYYISKEQLEQHPEWRAIVNGQPHSFRLKWTLPEVANAIADVILARLDNSYAHSVSLSPDDGLGWDESVDTKFDPGDWDPAMGTVSKTDRLILLCNRIAERVCQKYPDVLFGVLAYVDYTRPPVREKVHPNVVPQIAPITYNRAHPMTAEGHPNGKALLELVEGWAGKAQYVSHYWYGYNLAEVSAPNPFITKWGIDVPLCLKNNGKFWQPETLPNFETTMPGLYIGMRLAWDSSEDPKAIVDEMMTLFYGNAAGPMSEYWHHIDRAWVETDEYAGCGFGYMRIFRPEVLARARELMNQALEACRTDVERRRVQMADDSLRLFELFMKMRHDLAEGRFATLADDGARWVETVARLGEQYEFQYAFSRTYWAKETVCARYFNAFFHATYRDAARIAREAVVMTEPPLRSWKYKVDREKKGEQEGWHQPAFEDDAWQSTDVAVETWSTIGFHTYMGAMWYRNTVAVPAVPAGKRVYLWLAATDGSAKVFVNGQHVPYTKADGQVVEKFDGYCEPASFDITAVVRPGQQNSIALLCERNFLNELGTGGLLGPVVLYREK